MQKKKLLVKFASKGTDSFYDTIKHRVEDYFKSNDISKRANLSMKLKTAFMLALYAVPYLAIISGYTSSPLWLFYTMWLLMGFGIVGIGTSVMHDSNHGSYSDNKQLNNVLGGVLNILGGYARTWKIQHNILHHTYTNLDGLDEDIEAGKLLRMSPNAPYYKFHRFQYLYAWLLYAIMNLFWVTVKDFRQIIRYDKEGLLQKERISRRGAITELALFKVFYVAYILVLPICISGVSWYHVLGGFVLMQMIAGFGLACIFQPAHVISSSTFPTPSETGKMEDSWAIHQLLNTTNFSPKSRITSWFIGGLNYQIEHHLFPHICHIHYPKISLIVAEAAREHALPYNVQPTFAHALLQHAKMLKSLGRGTM